MAFTVHVQGESHHVESTVQKIEHGLHTFEFNVQCSATQKRYMKECGGVRSGNAVSLETRCLGKPEYIKPLCEREQMFYFKYSSSAFVKLLWPRSETTDPRKLTILSDKQKNVCPLHALPQMLFRATSYSAIVFIFLND
jgi:hypothetical protein